jgi:hypothetical protein
MSFTRKHYERAAEIIRQEREFIIRGGATGTPIELTAPEQNGAYNAVTRVTSNLSRMFAADNPRFDAARFAAACEPKGAK